jgi:hypothetical protein
MNQADTTSMAPGEAPKVLDYAPAPGPRLWPIGGCGLFLLSAFMLQATLLPCLCAAGTVKMNIAFALDAAFIGRVILARLLRQTNRDWIVYGIILMTSAVWIEWLAASDTVRSLLSAVGLMP